MRAENIHAYPALLHTKTFKKKGIKTMELISDAELGFGGSHFRRSDMRETLERTRVINDAGSLRLPSQV